MLNLHAVKISFDFSMHWASQLLASPAGSDKKYLLKWAEENLFLNAAMGIQSSAITEPQKSVRVEVVLIAGSL